MTKEKYEDSIAFTFGKVKQAGSASKAKNAAEMRKRLVVGFFVLAWYVFPMYVHPIVMCMVTLHIIITMQRESFQIKPKDFERTISYRVLRYAIQFLAFFILMPTIGPLERSIVEASGMTAEKYPLLFAILYDDLHDKILVALVSFSLIMLMCSWRQKTMRFQLRKAIGTGLVIAYSTGIAAVNPYTFIKGGRWWLYFGVLSVALNDSAAYFAGRLFGKHHLIGLSPNKTIEGFLGGCIGNVACCYLVSSYYLQGDFWQCPPSSFDVQLFEDWTCP